MQPATTCLGYGLGLRSEYYQEILEHRPPVDWFEVLSENYLVEGGKALYYLDAIGEHYPLVMHGVSLSIGLSIALAMAGAGAKVMMAPRLAQVTADFLRRLSSRKK